MRAPVFETSFSVFFESLATMQKNEICAMLFYRLYWSHTILSATNLA